MDGHMAPWSPVGALEFMDAKEQLVALGKDHAPPRHEALHMHRGPRHSISSVGRERVRESVNGPLCHLSQEGICKLSLGCFVRAEDGGLETEGVGGIDKYLPSQREPRGCAQSIWSWKVFGAQSSRAQSRSLQASWCPAQLSPLTVLSQPYPGPPLAPVTRLTQRQQKGSSYSMSNIARLKDKARMVDTMQARCWKALRNCSTGQRAGERARGPSLLGMLWAAPCTGTFQIALHTEELETTGMESPLAGQAVCLEGTKAEGEKGERSHWVSLWGKFPRCIPLLPPLLTEPHPEVPT